MKDFFIALILISVIIVGSFSTFILRILVPKNYAPGEQF